MTAPFIVFEGLDGAGKSTILFEVAAQLQDKNIPHMTVAFPASGHVGKLIRATFQDPDKIPEKAIFPLFAADAMEWDFAIRTATKEGIIVLCDRHVLVSAHIYQSHLYPPVLISSFLTRCDLLQPDHVFIVDIDAETAILRCKVRGKLNPLYEKEPEFGARREAYLHLAQWLKATVLDGSKPTEENVQKVLASLNGEKV